jgi:tetratricopeptide (TPR) repeat protein
MSNIFDLEKPTKDIMEDLQEFFEYMLMERAEDPSDELIKDTIAELQGLAMNDKLNGKTIIELRAQNKIAASYAKQGKIEESLAEIQQILTICPEHYAAFYTLGASSFEQENYEEALDCFKQAFEYNPFFTDAILRIYDCSVCLGDTSGVSALLSKALALQPKDPELLETREHLEAGTYPERIAKYMESKEIDPLKIELKKLKKMLESGKSQEALEKLKSLV